MMNNSRSAKTFHKDDAIARARTLLRPWEEVAGTVTDIKVISDSAVIELSFKRDIILEIPIRDLNDCSNKVEELIGKRVSILRTDFRYIMNHNLEKNSDSVVIHQEED